MTTETNYFFTVPSQKALHNIIKADVLPNTSFVAAELLVQPHINANDGKVIKETCLLCNIL